MVLSESIYAPIPYYEQDWDNHTTLHRDSVDTTPPSLTINNLTNKQLIYSISRPTYEKKSSLEKSFEAFLESTQQVQIIADSIFQTIPKSKILTLISMSNPNKKNLLT